jgi:uncharacterized membrane protein
MPLAPENYVPQLALTGAEWRRKAWRVWGIAGALLLAAAALIILAPLAKASGHSSLATAIYQGFSTLCHQMPGRSFHLRGEPFAVCARCAGLYFGLAAGVLAYPLLRSLWRLDSPPRGWLILSLLPVGLDFLLGYTGLWANNHWSRALTGGILGATIAFYLLPGLIDLRSNWRNYFRSGPVADKPLATIGDVKNITAVSDYTVPKRRIKV